MADISDQLPLQVLHLAQVFRRAYQRIVQFRDLPVSAVEGRACIAGTAQFLGCFIGLDDRFGDQPGHGKAHQHGSQHNGAHRQDELGAHRVLDLDHRSAPVQVPEKDSLQHPDRGNDKSRKNCEINQDLGPDTDPAGKELLPVSQIILSQSDSLPL